MLEETSPPHEDDQAPPPSKRLRQALPPAAGAAYTDGCQDIAQQFGCVVLIEVISSSPNFLQPWKNHTQRGCKGSGFVIDTSDGRRILTNFHVVQDAIDVRLRKHGMSRRWRGRVLSCGPEVDLAVLQVHEEEAGKGASFFDGVTPATWSSSIPALQSAVHVCGFPTGGNTISVTQGVVSRVDCKNYRVGPTGFASPGGMLVLQIDAAINAGNSGGPAFAKDGSVVGVAFQGLSGHADGIGYLIPALVCTNFLRAVVGGRKYGTVADVPFMYNDLRNDSLRRRHLVPEGTTGVLIKKVSEHAAVSLREGDVLVAVDGKPVGDDGTVELRASELVSCEFLLTCKPEGEPTSFSVLRSGSPLELSGVLAPLPRRLPRTNGFDASPEYVIIGGLLFVSLCCPMLQDKRSKSHSAAVYDLVHHQIAKSFAPASKPGAEGGEHEQEQVIVLACNHHAA